MISEGNFRITVGDDSEHENFTADICFGDLLVALVTQERNQNKFEIEIFPCPDADRWLFDFDEFIKVVNFAKLELLGKK
jgi:hypothetical protein